MIARPIWRKFERQTVFRPLAWAEERAGRSNAARRAMMAMTTSNSMRVKPRFMETPNLNRASFRNGDEGENERRIMDDMIRAPIGRDKRIGRASHSYR